MATVLLGNTAPIETVRPNPAVDVYEKIDLPVAAAITTYRIPDDVKLAEAIKTVSDTFNEYHSHDLPEWVESDDPVLAQALAQQFTTEEHSCVVGRPDTWAAEEAAEV